MKWYSTAAIRQQLEPQVQLAQANISEEDCIEVRAITVRGKRVQLNEISSVLIDLANEQQILVKESSLGIQVAADGLGQRLIIHGQREVSVKKEGSESSVDILPSVERGKKRRRGT
jgi:hypothetical protein